MLHVNPEVCFKDMSLRGKLQMLHSVIKPHNHKAVKQKSDNFFGEIIPRTSKLHHALAKPLARLHVPWTLF